MPIGRLALVLGWVVASAAPAIGQQVAPEPIEADKPTVTEQLSKVLNDPAAMEKAERERNRPPIEFFKTLILPNDVLPYVKANHWSTMGLELRSNQVNLSGRLETEPVPLLDMPHEVVFRRDVGLVKGQRSRLLLQVMIPTISKELRLRLERPESLLPDEYLAALRVLEPHQMLIPVLTKGTNDGYGRWGHLPLMFPLSGAKSDPVAYERQRYFRMVLSGDPDHPQLPGHPLTWTTISHVIWDGMAPETLSPSQQDAMLDWLHWGGQIIIVGGAGPSFAPLRESFLGPYLPSEPNGESGQLSSDDLNAFAKAYPPPAPSVEADEPIEGTQRYETAFAEYGRRYKDPVPIVIPKDKPLYVVTLSPKAGSRVIGFGKAGLPPFAVECRVGRGRVMMLGASINDPSLTAWPGYSTMLRRLVFRRPEEPLAEELRYNGSGSGGYLAPRYESLSGPDLTWTRILGRDLGAPIRRVRIDDDDDAPPPSRTQIGAVTVTVPPPSPTRPSGIPSGAVNLYAPYQVPVAEWLDTSALPRMSREKLEHASGIEIPGHKFVLVVIVAYVMALVPLNWLVCRMAFGRREWAWLFVPVLAIGFAVVVERAAAYDVGYDSACNEIDVIETFGNYPRGHLSRFASIYTTGRVKYSISFPGDPSALALPLNTGRAIRGEDIQQSVFQATPTPTLTSFQVQPRSLAMYRAEQYENLPGTVILTEEGGVRKVVNNMGVALQDAVVVEVGAKTSNTIKLGRIEPKATVEIKGEESTSDDYQRPEVAGLKKNQVDPSNFMELIVRSSIAGRPEDLGELRLVAWTEQERGGQTIEPQVDVHQGFTMVVAHLKLGQTPDPSSPRFDAIARGPESPSNRMLNTPPPPVNQRYTRPGSPAPPATQAKKVRMPLGAMPVMTPPAPVGGATPGLPGDGPTPIPDPETDRP